MENKVAEGQLDIEVRGSALWITFNRPEKLNAMTTAMFAQLDDGVRRLEDDDSLAAAVLTGAGTRAFCAGADVTDRIGKLTSQSWDRLNRSPITRFFSETTKPIIAAINGLCLGAGTEMTLGTDLRLAVEDAWFSLPEVSIGIVPAGGSHVRLPRQIPYAIAMEMILTGNRLSAARAYEIGMINRLAKDVDDLRDQVDELVEKLASVAPFAQRTAKEIVTGGMHLEPAFRFEHHLSERVFMSDDAAEGPRAFREKRPPQFVGH